MATFLALLKPSIWAFLPTLVKLFGGLLLSVIDKAKPLIEQAAKDQALPDGAARHEWVKNQLVPEIKSTGNQIVDAAHVELIGPAVKVAYELIKAKL